MYTTACDRCRRLRLKCIRPSRGQDPSEVCDHCLALDIACVTVKRRVGRQPGAKNRKRSRSDSKPYQRDSSVARDADRLPNPLVALASAAVSDTPVIDKASESPESTTIGTTSAVVQSHATWLSELNNETVKSAISGRIDALLADDTPSPPPEGDVFSGRIDMARFDASPEHDVITLQIISLSESERLYQCFLDHLTNAYMYLDPRIYTIAFMRTRSTFLLSVVLAIASTYTRFCSSATLHSQLVAHSRKLESHVRKNHFKSIEIVQGLLLLAMYSEVPRHLSHDRTWEHVAHAIALSVELKLDTPVPYCVQMDPNYSPRTHDMLVRCAHRAWFLLYLLDYNLAMFAGRYPILPASPITSMYNMNRWGKHPRAWAHDQALCSSVVLRKVIYDIQTKMDSDETTDLRGSLQLIERAVKDWRDKWELGSIFKTDWDIISRFFTCFLGLTVAKKAQSVGTVDDEVAEVCADLAFNVCCSAIEKFAAASVHPNSSTFDASMITFCALHVIQSINQSTGVQLSDKSLFRIAALQELVGYFETHAAARHCADREEYWSVNDAMARQLSRAIRLVLNAKRVHRTSSQVEQVTPVDPLTSNTDNHTWDNALPTDELSQFLLSNNTMPFGSEWSFVHFGQDRNQATAFGDPPSFDAGLGVLDFDFGSWQ